MQDHDFNRRALELGMLEQWLDNWGQWIYWRDDNDQAPRDQRCTSIESKYLPPSDMGEKIPKRQAPNDTDGVMVERSMRGMPKQYRFSLVVFYGRFAHIEIEETRMRVCAASMRTSRARYAEYLASARHMIFNRMKRDGVKFG